MGRPSRISTRQKSKPASARSVPRASSVSKQLVRRKTSGDVADNEPQARPEVNPDALPMLVDAARTLPLPEALSAAPESTADTSAQVCEDVPAERLIVFDYDGTITVDKDEKFKGLIGRRFARLKDMMGKIRASSTRCILVTAQFPHTTQETTIPALQKTTLSGLFEDEMFNSRLRLYWDDAAHGTVYNGAKVMLGKVDLIKKIINGDNCWGKSFLPSNVLFIDDDARNFRGSDQAGVKIRHVGQDGMVEEDMEIVEAFACGL